MDEKPPGEPTDTGRVARGLLTVMSGLLCASAVVASAGAAAVGLLLVPARADTWRDLETQPPAVTTWWTEAPPAAVALGIGLFCAALVAKELVVRNRAVTCVLNGLALLVGAGLVLSVILAVYLPLVNAAKELAGS